MNSTPARILSILLDFIANLKYNIIMENLREIVSKNIIELRKASNLTQIELAKKINYSDKAISRWEKGEVLPDIETIQVLSDVFNVPMSAILEKKENNQAKLSIPSKQDILSQIFIICEIWLILSVVYAYLNISKGHNIWQIFLWGIPATALILLMLNRKKKNNLTSFIYATVLVWSTITCIFLHMLNSCPWYIFILGVPAQGMLIVRFLFNYKRKPLIKTKRNK